MTKASRFARKRATSGRFKGWLAGSLAMLGLTFSVSGQEPKSTEGGPLPDGATVLIDEASYERAKIAGPMANAGRLEIAEVDDAPEGADFGKVLRFSSTRRTPNPHSVQVEVPVTAGQANGGDVLHVRMWTRTVETIDETNRGRFVFQLGQPGAQGGMEPPAAFFRRQATPAVGEWEIVDSPVVGSRRAIRPGTDALVLMFGNTQAQTLEIGGLQVLTYGPHFDPSTLPFKRHTYPGREEDASWRREARERIAQIRQGDLTVDVVDADGRPVEGAELDVVMTGHAYRFGTAIATYPGDPKHTGWEPKLFQDQVRTLFNHGGPANALKMSSPERDLAAADNILAWMKDHGMTVHAHVLVWPGWRFMDDHARSLRDDPEALRQYVRQYVTDMVTRYKGVVDEWDVLNETHGNRDLMNILGREEMAEWFKLAHAADPDATLYINENGIISGEKTDFYINEIRYLLEQGAPVMGVGCQGHVGTVAPERVIENLTKVGELGLPIQITEYDLVTPDRELQGDYTRDLMIAVFSHPSTAGFSMWGFWDGRHWLHDAPIYTKDWQLKPSGRQFIDLVFDEWWTRERATSDGEGRATVRGFLGDYYVGVTHNGRTAYQENVRLDRDGARVRVILPE